jgi:hypothetical protein
MTISPAQRQRIRERARFLCEYCHSSEEASAALFTFDHLVPQSLGGSDEEVNLALACHRCNGRRYNFTDGFDPKTQTKVPLFNPRRAQWSEHFLWSADGQTIIGTTPSTTVVTVVYTTSGGGLGAWPPKNNQNFVFLEGLRPSKPPCQGQLQL